MKAIALHDFEGGPAASELPTPEPASGELLVRVLGSSVNGFDVAVASGMLEGMMEYRFPVVLGTDFAGIVEQVGAGVSRYRAGDEVFGLQLAQGTLHDGSWAEYLVVAQDAFVARKPSTLDFTRSGALPLAGLTALHAVDAVDPEEGETVLIAGASGGVGGYAVQLAAQRGATVIATARADDADRLVRLGATETIDFRSADVASAVRERHHEGVDALIDLVHQADGLATLAGLVRDGGRVASTLQAADPAALAGRGIGATNVNGAAGGSAALSRLAEIVEAGRLEVSVQQVYALDEAPAAIEAFGEGKRGKLALAIER